MTPPFRAAAWALSLALFAASAFLSFSLAGSRVAAFSGGREAAPAGNLLHLIARKPAFSFGFRNFLADLAWLQAVQVAGARRLSGREYDRLDLLIRTVNRFDPRFDVPYFLGGLVLSDSPDHVGAALATLERGWKSHPGKWRFPFYVGYIRYFSLGEPVSGGRALEAAARLPGSPAYLPLLATRMFSEGRDPETALAFLRAMVRQESDPARVAILERRMREVVIERDIRILERAVAAYREKTGTVPANPSALVRAGLIRALPVEPNGGAYRLLPDGTVRSTKMSPHLEVFRKR